MFAFCRVEGVGESESGENETPGRIWTGAKSGRLQMEKWKEVLRTKPDLQSDSGAVKEKRSY